MSWLVEPVCAGANVGGNDHPAVTEITVGSAKRGWVEKPAVTDQQGLTDEHYKGPQDWKMKSAWRWN